ncbi:hypothetical protein [Salipiger mucosus]|uniref:Uncharacterized protein n=1 Tax=Salipiger mucosus DSM 16094 TaxID=1123237 RepID=S9S146_9RHOB|nr:hypothetical protein [Salipiger mucosus]EPX83945.1 hypothetical protein Salmuc_01720 [Salipiger mucosus DSM 16094]
MSSSKTEHRVPRDSEWNFLKIDIDGQGQLRVEQSKSPDLWSDREYRLLDKLGKFAELDDVLWTTHHADPTLNGDTYVLHADGGGYFDISLLAPVKEITPGCLLNAWDLEDPDGPGWQKMRSALQKKKDRAITDEDVRNVAVECLRSGDCMPTQYSALEIDVIHMDPTPDGPDEAEPADEIGPDTVFHATVKITYPYTLENHTIIEEIEDRNPADLANVLFRFDSRYPGAEPQVDIMSLDPDDAPGAPGP